MYLIVGSLFVFLLGIIGLSLVSFKNIRTILYENIWFLIIFILFNLIVSFMIYWHVRQENFIAYWELGGYWRKTLELNSLIKYDVPAALNAVYQSILQSDYPLLPELFMVTPLLVIGNTFTRYTVTMHLIFIIPFNLFMMIYGFQFTKSKKVLSLWGLILIMFSSNIYPLINGYIGSAGLVFIAYILLLVQQDLFISKNYLFSFFVSFILLILIFINRWYAYFVVSFFVIYGAYYLYAWFKDKFRFKSVSMRPLIHLFIMGATALLILVTAFYPVFVRFIGIDYAQAFADHAAKNPIEHITWFISNYGLVYIGLILCAVYAAFKNIQKTTVFLMSMHIILVIYLFSRVQLMGVHHFYTINVMGLILILMGLLTLEKWISKPKIFHTILISYCLIMGINYSYTLTHQRGTVHQISNTLIPSSFPWFRIREDVSKVQAVTRWLQEHAHGASIYILSASNEYNSDVFQNSLIPHDLYPIANLGSTHQLDKMDGLPSNFFHYHYVVVVNPLQVQFGRDASLNVALLADEFNETNGRLNPYYLKVFEVQLKEGHTASIYRIMQDIPLEIKNSILKAYSGAYPESNPYFN